MNIVDLGVMNAQQNMDSDYERLRKTKSSDSPSLRFYKWEKPALTYGYFSKPLNASIDQGRRPTGGGLIFHTCDLAFSVIIPAESSYLSSNTLENYRFINQIVQKALIKLKFNPLFLENRMPTSSYCMAEPTLYDLLIDGKKAVGAAQRKVKEGLLHQGSISLRLPGIEEKLFLQDDLIYQTMLRETFPLNLSASTVQEALIEAFHFSLK